MTPPQARMVHQFADLRARCTTQMELIADLALQIQALDTRLKSVEAQYALGVPETPVRHAGDPDPHLGRF